MKLNVPNFLTILRIFSIPALVVVLVADFRGWEIAGFAIFLFASLTDMLDGFWARKKKQITVFGQNFAAHTSSFPSLAISTSSSLIALTSSTAVRLL